METPTSTGTVTQPAPLKPWKQVAEESNIFSLPPEQRIAEYDKWSSQVISEGIKNGDFDSPDTFRQFKLKDIRTRKNLASDDIIGPSDDDIATEYDSFTKPFQDTQRAFAADKPTPQDEAIQGEVLQGKRKSAFLRGQMFFNPAVVNDPQKYREAILESDAPADIKMFYAGLRPEMEESATVTRRRELANNVITRDVADKVVTAIQEGTELFGMDIGTPQSPALKKNKDGVWSVVDPEYVDQSASMLDIANARYNPLGDSQYKPIAAINEYQQKYGLTDEQVQQDYMESLIENAPTSVNRWFGKATSIEDYVKQLDSTVRVKNKDVAPEVRVQDPNLFFDEQGYNAAVDKAKAPDEAKNLAKAARTQFADAVAGDIYNNLLNNRDDFREEYAKDVVDRKDMEKAITRYYKDKKDQAWYDDVGEMFGQAGTALTQGGMNLIMMPSAIKGMFGSVEDAEDVRLATMVQAGEMQAEEAVANRTGGAGFIKLNNDVMRIIPDLAVQMGLAVGTGWTLSGTQAAILSARTGIGKAAAKAAIQQAAITGEKAALKSQLLKIIPDLAGSAVDDVAEEALKMSARAMSNNPLKGGVGTQRAIGSAYAGLTSASSTFGRVYTDVRKMGKSPEEAIGTARTAAVVAGAITSGLTHSFGMLGRGGVEDFASMGRKAGEFTVRDIVNAGILDSLTTQEGRQLIRNIAKGFGRDALSEGAEEGLDQALNLISQYATNPSPEAQNRKATDIINESLYATLLGGIAGGGAFTVGQARASAPGVTAQQMQQEVLGAQEPVAPDVAPPVPVAPNVAPVAPTVQPSVDPVVQEAKDTVESLADIPDTSQTAAALAALANAAAVPKPEFDLPGIEASKPASEPEVQPAEEPVVQPEPATPEVAPANAEETTIEPTSEPAKVEPEPTENMKTAQQTPKEGRFSIYQSGGRWLVQQGEKRGVGDYIFSSQADAEAEAARAIDMERKNAAFSAKQEAKDTAEKAAQEEKEKPLNEYLDAIGATPMQRGKLKASLKEYASRKSVSTGKTYQGERIKVVRDMVNDGYAAKAEQVDAIQPLSGSRMNIMDNRQQAEFEKRRAAAGKKTQYMLSTSNGGSFVVTKSEYDYAKWIEQKTKPEVARDATKPEQKAEAPAEVKVEPVAEAPVAEKPKPDVAAVRAKIKEAGTLKSSKAKVIQGMIDSGEFIPAAIEAAETGKPLAAIPENVSVVGDVGVPKSVNIDRVTAPKIKPTTPEIAARSGVSTDETRYVLNGVLLDKDAQKAVATDGRMLIVIPTKVDGATRIVSKTGDIIDGNYPQWQNVIPRPETKGFEVDSDEALRASVVLDGINNTFSRAYKSGGTWRSESGVRTLIKIGDGYFEPGYIKSAFTGLLQSGAKTITARVDDSLSPILLSGDNGAFVVLMPIRITNNPNYIIHELGPKSQPQPIKPDAVQKPSSDAGVLRQEGQEVGLPEVDQGGRGAKQKAAGQEGEVSIPLTEAQTSRLNKIPELEALDAQRRGLGFNYPTSRIRRLPGDPNAYVSRSDKNRIGVTAPDGSISMLSAEESALILDKINAFEKRQEDQFKQDAAQAAQEFQKQEEKKFYRLSPSSPVVRRLKGKWINHFTGKPLGNSKNDQRMLSELEDNPNIELYRVVAKKLGDGVAYVSLEKAGQEGGVRTEVPAKKTKRDKEVFAQQAPSELEQQPQKTTLKAWRFQWAGADMDMELIGQGKDIDEARKSVRAPFSAEATQIQDVEVWNDWGVAHQSDINRALLRNEPVSSEAVDLYEIKLPRGYIKKDDLYVFDEKPEAKTELAREQEEVVVFVDIENDTEKAVVAAEKKKRMTPGKARKVGIAKQIERLGINSNDPDSVISALEKITAKPLQKHHARIAKDLLSVLKGSGVQIQLVSGNDAKLSEGDSRVNGWYDPKTNTAYINLDGPHELGIEETILHELVHASGEKVIQNPQTEAQKRILGDPEKQMLAARKNAIALGKAKMGVDVTDLKMLIDMAKAQNDYGLFDILYGVSSLSEYHAHATTSRSFQKFLATYKEGGKRSLFERFVNSITSLLSGKKTAENSDAEKAYATLLDLMREGKGDMRKSNTDTVQSLARGVLTERDAEYLELAKDPEKNAEALQAMVDEAAKAAGIGSPRSVPNGKLLSAPVYWRLQPPGWQLNPDFRSANQNDSSYKEQGLSVWPSLQDLLENQSGGQADYVRGRVEIVAIWGDEVGTGLDGEPLIRPRAEAARFQHPDLDDYLRSETMFSAREMRDNADSLDSIDEFVDIPWGWIRIPEMEMEFDPVTRDDAGNVIPLSQRLNPIQVKSPQSRARGIVSDTVTKYAPEFNVVDDKDGPSVFFDGRNVTVNLSKLEGLDEYEVKDLAERAVVAAKAAPKDPIAAGIIQQTDMYDPYNFDSVSRKEIRKSLAKAHAVATENGMAPLAMDLGVKLFEYGGATDAEVRKSMARGTASDEEYLAAVEAGDMEKSQQMVDEAAKAAGYNIGPVWHKTLADFSIFDLSKSSRSAVWGPAIYASFNKDWNPASLSGGRVITGFVGGAVIDMTKPLTQEAESMLSDLLGREIREVVPFLSLEKRFGSVAEGLRAAGFSAAIHDGPGGTGRHIAVFSPEQIKSADPVTRDDAGNIIPLSQRFQSESPDIRYSKARGTELVTYIPRTYSAPRLLFNKLIAGFRSRGMVTEAAYEKFRDSEGFKKANASFTSFIAKDYAKVANKYFGEGEESWLDFRVFSRDATGEVTVSKKGFKTPQEAESFAKVSGSKDYIVATGQDLMNKALGSNSHTLKEDVRDKIEKLTKKGLDDIANSIKAYKEEYLNYWNLVTLEMQASSIDEKQIATLKEKKQQWMRALELRAAEQRKIVDDARKEAVRAALADGTNRIIAQQEFAKAYLPDDLVYQIGRARGKIDELSNQLREIKWLMDGSELEMIIGERLEVYVTRSYEAFETKDRVGYVNWLNEAYQALYQPGKAYDPLAMDRIMPLVRHIKETIVQRRIEDLVRENEQNQIDDIMAELIADPRQITQVDRIPGQPIEGTEYEQLVRAVAKKELETRRSQEKKEFITKAVESLGKSTFASNIGDARKRMSALRKEANRLYEQRYPEQKAVSDIMGAPNPLRWAMMTETEAHDIANVERSLSENPGNVNGSRIWTSSINGLKHASFHAAVSDDFQKNLDFITGAPASKTGLTGATANDWKRLGDKILEHKNDVPAFLRTFLGEKDNPLLRVSDTILKQSHLVAVGELYQNLAEVGMKEGWLIDAELKPTDSKYSNWKPILNSENTDQGYGSNPFKGLYADPVMIGAINTLLAANQPSNTATKVISRIIGYSLWAVTAGSVKAIVRNLSSLGAFLLNSGILSAVLVPSRTIPVLKNVVLAARIMNESMTAVGKVSGGKKIEGKAFQLADKFWTGTLAAIAAQRPATAVIKGASSFAQFASRMKENPTKEQAQEVYQLAVRLNVANDNVQKESMERLLDLEETISRKPVDRNLGRFAKALKLDGVVGFGSYLLGTIKTAGQQRSQLYGAPDDFTKILAWLNEMDAQARIHSKDKAEYNKWRGKDGLFTDMPEEYVRRAANYTTDLIQSHSKVWAHITQFKKMGFGTFIAPFIAARAEFYRNMVNAYRIAFAEMRSDIPMEKANGWMRFASALMAHFAYGTMASAVLKMIFRAFADDEEVVEDSPEIRDAIRRLAPEYAKNKIAASVLYKNGTFDWIDISFSTPFAFVWESIYAGRRAASDADVDDFVAWNIARDVLGENLGNFVSPQIAVGAGATMISGFDPVRGIKIWDSQADSTAEKVKKATLYYLKQAGLPGDWKSAMNIYNAAKGVEENGRKYKVGTEVAGVFLGASVRTIKVTDMVRQKLSQAKDNLNARITPFYNAQLGDSNVYGPEDFVGAAEKYHKTGQDAIKRMQRVVSAGRVLLAPAPDGEKMLRSVMNSDDVKMNATIERAIMSGKSVPSTLSPQTRQKVGALGKKHDDDRLPITEDTLKRLNQKP